MCRNIMGLVFLALLNYGIVSLRYRLATTLFQGKNKTTKYITLFIGSAIAGAIYAYPHLLQAVHLTMFSYTTTPLDSSVGFLVILYLSIFLVLLGIIFRSNRKKLLLICIFSVCLGGGMVALLTYGNRLSSVAYFVTAALVEEFGKAVGALSLSKKNSFLGRDAAIMGILIALGFAFMENLVYMYALATGLSLSGSIALITSRGAVTFLMHTIFTGSILALAYNASQHTSFFARAGGIIGAALVGIFLHAGWNKIVDMQFVLGIAIFVTGGYVLLSYIFYRSDDLYISELITNKNE